MNVDQILKEAHEAELDVTAAILLLIDLQSINNSYLQEILRKQLEIQEELKGNPGADITEKFEQITKDINELSETKFYKLLPDVLK